MNYGMSVSASGTLAALHRLDTLSNNLANAETPGFQADFALAMQRPAPSAAADAPDPVSYTHLTLPTTLLV